MTTVNLWSYLIGSMVGGIISFGLGWMSCMTWNDIDKPFWANITEAWRRQP